MCYFWHERKNSCIIWKTGCSRKSHNTQMKYFPSHLKKSYHLLSDRCSIKYWSKIWSLLSSSSEWKTPTSDPKSWVQIPVAIIEFPIQIYLRNIKQRWETARRTCSIIRRNMWWPHTDLWNVTGRSGNKKLKQDCNIENMLLEKAKTVAAFCASYK